MTFDCLDFRTDVQICTLHAKNKNIVHKNGIFIFVLTGVRRGEVE